MLQKLSGNTEDSQLIRHGMKAHLIFELYSTLLVPFGKLKLEFFLFPLGYQIFFIFSQQMYNFT